SGKEMEMGFIFIHGQDHLMTTLLLRDLIQDFIVLYRQNQG
ncbi:TPA: PTS lactose/cellobiose transporter subunit IIA, partial [Enterococcus faecium]|nr:PTS lactose/cellobiose transporter subunit IIA [Enterococcus faecium]